MRTHLRALLFAGAILALHGTMEARAAVFTFQIEFTSGELDGISYVGTFVTETSPPDNWVPEGSAFLETNETIDILESLQITVDGQLFTLADDVDFPDLPRIRVGETVELFDYAAHAGGKRLVILYPLTDPSVAFGEVGENPHSRGELVAVSLFTDPTGPDQEGIPVPPPEDTGRFSGLTAEQIRAVFYASEPSAMSLLALGLLALTGGLLPGRKRRKGERWRRSHRAA